MSLFVNNKILDLLMLFSEAGGCSKHFFGVRCSFGHPMEGFQSFFPNFVTHQILLCTPKLKRPRVRLSIRKVSICHTIDMNRFDTLKQYCSKLRCMDRSAQIFVHSRYMLNLCTSQIREGFKKNLELVGWVTLSGLCVVCQ